MKRVGATGIADDRERLAPKFPLIPIAASSHRDQNVCAVLPRSAIGSRSDLTERD